MSITRCKALSGLCIHSCPVYRAMGKSINCHASPVPAGSRLFDKDAAADFTKKILYRILCFANKCGFKFGQSDIIYTSYIDY